VFVVYCNRTRFFSRCPSFSHRAYFRQQGVRNSRLIGLLGHASILGKILHALSQDICWQLVSFSDSKKKTGLSQNATCQHGSTSSFLRLARAQKGFLSQPFRGIPLQDRTHASWGSFSFENAAPRRAPYRISSTQLGLLQGEVEPRNLLRFPTGSNYFCPRPSLPTS